MCSLHFASGINSMFVQKLRTILENLVITKSLNKFTVSISYVPGISMICGVGLASLFLIEVAPMEYRGSSGALIQIFRGLGGTMGMVLALPELLGRPHLWTLALAIPAGPAILQFLVLIFCRESPRHLFITAGQANQAAKAIRFYQGSARVTQALQELTSEKVKIQSQRKMKMN